jgi:arylsulfatase A-like enzyme
MKPNRRDFLRASAALPALADAQPPPGGFRNILLLCDDQHNARNLGCYGDSFVRTPHLDRLAARGVRFTRGYANGMICAPSRISMTTGQYVHSHGYYGNSGAPSERQTWLTSHLRRHGYQTAMIGKAHYGWDKVRREFDHVRLCNHSDCPPDDPLKHDYFKMLVEKNRWRDFDLLRRGPDVGYHSLLPKELSLEAWTRDSAVEFLRTRDRSKPFFAFVSFDRPHAPITPPAPYDTMYNPADVPLPPSARESLDGKPAEQRAAAKRSTYPYHPSDPRKLQEIMAGYFGLITLIDECVGGILAELDAQGLTRNTLILFVSDHGDFSGEHGFFHKNLGMYECIHRIPFLMAGPGVESGLVREQLVEQIDLYPTACEFAGVPIPDSVQGRSLLPLGRSGSPRWTRAAAFAETETRMCIRTARHRMVFDPGGDANELYDHDDDPWEGKNRYSDPTLRAVRLELAEELLRYRSRAERQTLVTSLKSTGGGGQMPPGPTNDLFWKGMDWDAVKKKYGL